MENRAAVVPPARAAAVPAAIAVLVDPVSVTPDGFAEMYVPPPGIRNASALVSVNDAPSVCVSVVPIGSACASVDSQTVPDCALRAPAVVWRFVHVLPPTLSVNESPVATVPLLYQEWNTTVSPTAAGAVVVTTFVVAPAAVTVFPAVIGCTNTRGLSGKTAVTDCHVLLDASTHAGIVGIDCDRTRL